jgi:hypothetical protein
MIKVAADCGGGCFSFHLEDKYRNRYTMIIAPQRVRRAVRLAFPRPLTFLRMLKRILARLM